MSLYAEFTALEGHVEEVTELVQGLVREVRAEHGNVAFDAWVRREHPREFVVFETYRDPDAFQAHLGSAHSVAFNARLGPLVDGGGSSLTWLTTVDRD